MMDSSTTIHDKPLGLPLSLLPIPPELVQPICAFITDRRTLYSLTLSSHILRQEAERCLYASPMTLPSCDADDTYQQHYRGYWLPRSYSTNIFAQFIPMGDYERHIAFLRTITTTPRLAVLVRAYHSAPLNHSADHLHLWDLVKEGLCAMTGLKSLIMRESWNDYGPAAAYLLFGQRDSREGQITISPGTIPKPSFQLHSLCWPFVGDEEPIMHFLTFQPNLRHLHLEIIFERHRNLFEGSANDPKFLPLLECVGGSYLFIRTFLTRKNVTHLVWKNLNGALTWRIGEEKRFIKTISFGSYFQNTLEFSVAQTLIMADHRLLASFPQLQRLIFCTPDWDSSASISKQAAALKSFAKSLFESCNSLHCVDIALFCNCPNQYNTGFVRWKRSALGGLLEEPEFLTVGKVLNENEF